MSLRHFGASHFSKLRHFFSVHLAGVEIDVEVIPPSTGGGGWFGTPQKPTRWDHARPYVIVVKVKRNGKTWTATAEAPVVVGKSMEKVIATFKGISVLFNKINISTKFLRRMVKDITIRAKGR